MSSPNLKAEKHYLPSRYGLDAVKKDTNMLTLLNCTCLNTQPSNSTQGRNRNWNCLHRSNLSLSQGHDLIR